MLGIIFMTGCEGDDISSEQSKYFVKFFGSHSLDYGNDVLVLTNGYIITGTKSTLSNGDDAVVIRTDKNGNLLWEETYGSAEDENGNCILQAGEEGFMVLGTARDTTGKTDILLLYINNDGELQWEKKYGNASNERGKAIIPTNNGYLILGATDAANPGTNNPSGATDILLMEVNVNGEINWQSAFGGSGNDEGNDLVKLNNDYLIIGSTNSFQTNGQDNANIWLLHVNSFGGLMNMTTLGGLSNDIGHSAARHTGGIVIVGTSNSQSQSGSDMILYNIQEDLSSIDWATNLGGDGNDEGKHILIHNNQAVAVGSNAVTGGAAGYLVKVNLSDGQLIAENNFGGQGTQVINKVRQAPDKGYVFIGSSNLEQNSMIILTKTNHDGKLNN
jgi:hypothetical protein